MNDQENPFIVRPDEHVEGGANELYCWLHPDRECNGSCIAFGSEDESAEMPCLVLRSILDVSQTWRHVVLAGAKAQKAQALANTLARLPDPPEVR